MLESESIKRQAQVSGKHITIQPLLRADLVALDFGEPFQRLLQEPAMSADMLFADDDLELIVIAMIADFRSEGWK